jgi:hypothetical protein
MPKHSATIPSLNAFAIQFPALAEREKNSRRWQMLERYFSRGGVISLGALPNGTEWPEIIYPTRMKLGKDLEHLEGMRRELEKKIGEWKSTKTQAQWQDLSNEIKKFSEPVYWRHMQRYFTNKDYRKDADTVKLPVKLVSEKRWKPMIEMFVKDLDYRKQLAETVETSVVYAKDKRVARFADLQKQFRLEQSQKNLAQLQKKLEELNLDISMLKELENWSKK